MDGLAKPERSEGFGADVGDKKKRHGGRFFDASHREQSELGETRTLGAAASRDVKKTQTAPEKTLLSGAVRVSTRCYR